MKSHSTIYFDAGCPFCTKTKNFLTKREKGNLVFKPLSNKNIAYFTNTLGISKKKAYNAMYYVNKSGNLLFGADACFAYLRGKQGFLYAIGKIGSVKQILWFARYIYDLIAINRFKISYLIR